MDTQGRSESPEQRISRLRLEPEEVTVSDAKFLLDQITLRQHALDVVVSDSMPGRLFGIREAAELLRSSGLRLKIMQKNGEGQFLIKSARVLEQYADDLSKKVKETLKQ